MADKREIRTGYGEVRALDAPAGEETARPRIIGYAARFNVWSEELGGFRERILPGAFAETIRAGTDIRALWNHNRDLVLGRTTNGTLRLFEDDQGLRFEIDPPETTWARDALISIQRGDVNQMSFGFEAIEDEWREVDGRLERDLIRVRLFDVSPVSFPAYTETSAEVRARVAQLQAAGDPEAGDAADDGDGAGPQARLALRHRWLELAEREIYGGDTHV